LGERIVMDSSAKIPCPWLIVRPTSIWGPWFEIPYKTFFLTIAQGKYFHPGAEKILKSFGFVGNTVYQLQRLIEAPLDSLSTKTIYLGDYPPVDIAVMANQIQEKLIVPKIRRMDLRILHVAAKCGDFLKYLGWKYPPLTSFRLNNLVTQMTYDLEPLRLLVGELPYTMPQGVDITVNWLKGNGEVS
jgi:nucleoside-diphosphate-sugar epimerase